MVSVCLASYNGEPFIEDQVKSILAQLQFGDELIVSDDCSTDNTVKILSRINDNRLKLHINTGPHGFTPNFENALKYATGDIIFLSDQDDIWLPGKYDACLQALQKYDLIVTNSKVTDEKLNVINESFFSIYSSGAGILKNIFICSTYYGSCMAFRKSLLKYALPFPKYKELGHDLWLGLVAETVGQVKFIDTPYLLYRRLDSSVTVVGNLLTRSKKPLLQKIQKRFIIYKYFLDFFFKYKLQKKQRWI